MFAEVCSGGTAFQARPDRTESPKWGGIAAEREKILWLGCAPGGLGVIAGIPVLRRDGWVFSLLLM